MDTTAILLILLTAFLSTFIQRVTGFGFGIVFMSVVPFLMPSYGEAVTLSGVLALVCNAGAGIPVTKYLKWKKMAIILAVFLVVSYFSVRIVTVADNDLMKRILGVFLIAVAIYFYCLNGKIRMKPTVPVQAGMGVVSGVMGGLFGIQGPPAVLYFISCTDDKNEYMALTQWYFLIGNVWMTFSRAHNGLLTPAVERACLPGAAAVILGLLLGRVVYSRMNIGTIRKGVYIFIAVAGIVALLA